MGENGVYRQQFYTKLVSSCHFVFSYLYICSFFLFVLRLVRCVSNSEELSESIYFIPSTCGSITTVRNVSQPRDDQRCRQATKSLWTQATVRGRSYLWRADF